MAAEVLRAFGADTNESGNCKKVRYRSADYKRRFKPLKIKMLQGTAAGKLSGEPFEYFMNCIHLLNALDSSKNSLKPQEQAE